MRRMFILTAIMLTVMTVQAQSDYRVKFNGAQPGIADFVNAIIAIQNEDGGECRLPSETWHQYQGGKALPQGVKVTLDRKNGYVRIDDAVSNAPDYTIIDEMCFWNLSDKRHKLVAVNVVLRSQNGIAVTECTGVNFYKYDNTTHKLNFAGINLNADLEYTNGGEVSHALPQTGKDIVETKWFPTFKVERVLGWNDGDFQPKEGSATVQKLDGSIVLVVNPMAEAHWESMKGVEASAVEVGINEVAVADKVWQVPGNGHLAVVEGCPDGRNVWSYIVDLNTSRVCQLPTNEGVERIDNGEIIASSYGYDEDGRYTYRRAYSVTGEFIRQVGDKERE